MNQPTREEFEDLKEEVRKLKEQQTEPIQITVERKYPDRELLQEVLRKQDEHFGHIKGELASILARQSEYDKGLMSHSRSISALQEEMRGVRADILSIKATQSDHSEMLKNTASKEDLKKLETRFEARIDRLESTQVEHSQLLREILNRLPAKQ